MTAPEQTAKRAKRTPTPRDPDRKSARYAEAADLLERHNEWRRGGGGPQTPPGPLGLAIELAIKVLRQRHGIRP